MVTSNAENTAAEQDVAPTQSILVDNPSADSDSGEEQLRQKYYDAFVKSKELRTVVVKSPREELAEKQKKLQQQRQQKKKAKAKTRTKRKKAQEQKKATAEQKALSPEEIKGELARRMRGIHERLLVMQSKAHEEFMRSEAEYSIKNVSLFEKIFPSYLETLTLRWDEIVDTLVDDLLYDVVRELNVIESADRARGTLLHQGQSVTPANLGMLDVLHSIQDYLDCEQSVNARMKAFC